MGYSKEVYDKAWEIVDARRTEARQTLSARQAEVRRKVPQVAAIQREMIDTAAGITKAVVQNPNKAGQLVEELGRKNLELQEKRERLLVEAGFPRDYLKETYTCSRCEDTGYVEQTRCVCFDQILRQQAFAQLSHVSDGKDYSFDNFQVDFYPSQPDDKGVVPRQRMSEIYEFCKVYADNFALDSQNLMMMGNTGLGKTHLSLAIAWELTTQGFGVVYSPVQKLLDRLEANKFSYDQEAKATYASDMESVMQCDLLVLDDLGTEFPTSFTRSVLYNIVNTRIVEGRPTIINTNLNPAELEQHYSPRMASRLGFTYKILRFYGEDIRFLKRRRRHQRGSSY